MSGRGHEDIFAADIEWRPGQDPGIEYARFPVDRANAAGPVVILSKFDPGARVGTHTHDTNYFEYILAGEQTVGKTLFRTGDVRLARAGATPIYTRALGGHIGGQDLAVELRSSQDLAIINQKVPVTARISHTGLASVKANVALLHDGKEIARRETLLTAAAPSASPAIRAISTRTLNDRSIRPSAQTASLARRLSRRKEPA